MSSLKKLGLLLLATVLLSSSSYANELTEFGGDHGMLSGCTEEKQNKHVYLMNSDKLELTDKQIKKLRNVRGECKTQCVLDKAKLRVAKVELGEELKHDVVDMSVVEKKVSEVSDLMRRLLLRSIQVNVEAAMILTEEQKEKAKALKK